MGAFKYTITVESDAPPQLFLGAVIGGATVVEMRQEKVFMKGYYNIKKMVKEPSHKQ